MRGRRFTEGPDAAVEVHLTLSSSDKAFVEPRSSNDKKAKLRIRHMGLLVIGPLR